MRSCLPRFYSVVLYSCFSHEPALVHALLIPKPSSPISLLGLHKSDHINSLLLPAKPRNISVIFSFRCEVYSTLQGRFALPVYLQDFYFPFTPKHFFLDLESPFGRFRSCSPAAHPGSSAVPNARARGRERAGGAGNGSVLQRRLQPARPPPHLGELLPFGAARCIYQRPWRVSVCSRSELRGTRRGWHRAFGECSQGCRCRAALLGSSGLG